MLNLSLNRVWSQFQSSIVLSSSRSLNSKSRNFFCFLEFLNYCWITSSLYAYNKCLYATMPLLELILCDVSFENIGRLSTGSNWPKFPNIKMDCPPNGSFNWSRNACLNLRSINPSICHLIMLFSFIIRYMIFSNRSYNCFKLLLLMSKRLQLKIGIDSVEYIMVSLMLYAVTPVRAITRTNDLDRFPNIDRSSCHITLIRYDLSVPAVSIIIICNTTTWFSSRIL